MIKEITLGLLAFGYTSLVSAQLSTQQKAAMKAYLQERISTTDEETHLVSYNEQTKLPLKEIPQAKSQVWALWKETYLSQDSLPTWTQVSAETSNYPVHTWTLKREDPMPFYFIRKGTGDASQKHALFLNLHGSGPKAMEFKNTLAWTMRYQDAPSIYFIPQIPSEKRYRWWYKPVQYSWERLFRLAMLSDAVDPNKIYVMGISEGGYGSQRLGAFYADYLAGAGPMAGGEPLKNAPPLNYRNIAFSLETGENDRGFGRNTLTAAAKHTFDSLENVYPGSFSHKIVLQPGKGHGIDYTPTTPWLVKHTRVTNPKHMSFILFPMDGRYRKGFYNVALTSTLAQKEGEEFDRVLFDIRYEGNEVHVSAQLMNNEMTETKEATKLNFSLFLDEGYVDLTKKVAVYVNGKRVFHAKPALKWSHLAESCALFGDSQRLYPAKVSIAI